MIASLAGKFVMYCKELTGLIMGLLSKNQLWGVPAFVKSKSRIRPGQCCTGPDSLAHAYSTVFP